MGKEKIAKVLLMLCLTPCADDRQRFEQGEVYSLPADHPCLKHFEPVTETTDRADLGPPGTVLVAGGKR